jgi:hypothetical protein
MDSCRTGAPWNIVIFKFRLSFSSLPVAAMACLAKTDSSTPNNMLRSLSIAFTSTLPGSQTAKLTTHFHWFKLATAMPQVFRYYFCPDIEEVACGRVKCCWCIQGEILVTVAIELL